MASFDEVKLEDILHCSFATFNPDTGANKDADSLPTAVVYEEGSSTALVSTVTVTNMTTGRYRLNVTIAAADGYEAGKYYELWVSATVTGTGSPVTQSAPLVSFKATTSVVDDTALAATALSTAIWTGTKAGYLDAAITSRNAIAPATPTNVSDVQTAILAKLPAALVSGRIDASVGAMATDVITAAALATDAGTEIQANLATEAYIAQILTTYVVEVF